MCREVHAQACQHRARALEFQRQRVFAADLERVFQPGQAHVHAVFAQLGHGIGRHGDAYRQAGLDATIPPRKYDDAALARVAAISTNVLCECPRHVAEIIAQLVSFEQYSQECLNKSSEDAHLHAYLRSVSGSARALFEHALERVAAHEGLVLSGPD